MKIIINDMHEWVLATTNYKKMFFNQKLAFMQEYKISQISIVTHFVNLRFIYCVVYTKVTDYNLFINN